MNRPAALQLLGPVTLFLAGLAAEGAAYALATHPASAILWYVNLNLFGIFQRSYYVLSDFIPVPCAQLVVIGLPIIVMAGYGYLRERPLLLAIASNLGLVYEVFLGFSWYWIERPPSLLASSAPIAIPSGSTLSTLSVLLAASLVSFVVSHLVQFRAIRAKA
jgi:hypothetical protein